MITTRIEHKGYRGAIAASGRVQILAGYTTHQLDSDAQAAYRLQAYAEYLTLMSNAAVDAIELNEGVIGIQAGSSKLRRKHGDLIKAGMAKAQQSGRRIGRPRVTERKGFPQRFAATVTRIERGTISVGEAAKELKISPTTMARLLRPDSD